MRALVVYQSKTGFTKKYAQWVKEALGGELTEAKNLKNLDLAQYDVLVYGGYCHAGMIAGVKKFMKIALPLKKKTAVFAVGASPAENPEIDVAMRKNFTDEQWAAVKAFYCPGGLCYENMGAMDKMLMSMFRAMTKKTEGEDSEMYKLLQKSYDLSDEKYIAPLVEWCREQA